MLAARNADSALTASARVRAGTRFAFHNMATEDGGMPRILSCVLYGALRRNWSVRIGARMACG